MLARLPSRLSTTIHAALLTTLATTLAHAHLAPRAHDPQAPDPSRVFDLPSGRPTSIIITRSVDTPPGMGESSPMLDTIAGVIGTLPARDWNRLRAMVRAGQQPESLDGTALVGVMHLRSATASKRVEILRLPDSSLIASEIDPMHDNDQAAAAVLPPEFAQIMSGWNHYQGGFGPTDTPMASNVDMPHPYIPASITFDPETLGDRLLSGGRTNLRGMARELETETLWVRLPAGYDPRTPAGLLVWVDPTESGQPPEFMHPAADAMNFIIVGAASAGNDRHVADRHQLTFDAIANATIRYHVDPTRVYAVGASGGARLACMYWGAFPHTFTGAVAIVGAAAYDNVPIGNGQYLPREYLLPDGVRALLRKQRLAAISGPPDFNFVAIDRIIHAIASDGFPARLFDYDDMGHNHPRPERFTNVLEWVDEPWKTAQADALDRAATMLEGYKSRQTGPPTSPAQREALIRITQLAPWSAPAWEAAALLGVARQ